MSGTATPKYQPKSWQESTRINVERVQIIFGIDPTLTHASKLVLYGLAHEMATKMAPSGSTEYWGIFINSLRTLVAGQCNVNPKDIFD